MLSLLNCREVHLAVARRFLGEKHPYLYVDVHGALSSAEVSTLLFFRAFSAACEL